MTRFYHVDRIRNRLQSGQVIDFIHDKTAVVDATDRAKLYLEMFPSGVTFHGWNYLLSPDRLLPREDTNGMIEMLAELIRRSYYPRRLSRFQAVFVFKTIEEAKEFIASYPVKLPDGTRHNQGDIWEVEGDNIELETDMRRLSLGKVWLDALVNLHAYWQGVCSSSPLREVLLRPPVRVVRKVTDHRDGK